VRTAICRPTSSRLIFQDSHRHDATILWPRDTSALTPPLHLLGDEMVSGRVSTWDSSLLRIPLRRHRRQVEWTRYILKRERDILRSAGIYDLIYLSLFDYSVDTSLLHAFSERWSYTTNTLLLDDREMTLTLWELRQLTGLPITGQYCYDEFEISGDDLADPIKFPDSLRSIYEIYDTLRGHHSHVPFRYWIAHFTSGCPSPAFQGPVPVEDPLGIGSPLVHYRGDFPPQRSICFPSFDRETYLTAFLSWWICYFLLPTAPIYTIRPSAFVMASRMARGQRVSLVVPVLANIYRGLRGLVSSRDPSSCRELIPYHFIAGWIHMHFLGLYRPAALPESMRLTLPLLAEIAGTTATIHHPEGARFRFYDCKKHLRPPKARFSTLYSGRLTDRLITDEIPPFGGSSIVWRHDDFEYLVSIRCGFLPLRFGCHAVIEPYSPHRCAHQFSLDQDIPLMLRRPPYLAVDMVGLGWCYSFLFRSQTESHCQMVSCTRTFMFSQGYQEWYFSLITAYQSVPPRAMVGTVCPSSGGVRKRVLLSIDEPESTDDGLFPSVRGGPLDFQGLDSRFSFIPFRSFIAGTYFYPIMIYLFLKHSFNNYKSRVFIPRFS